MITGWTDIDDERYTELKYNEMREKYSDFENIIINELKVKGYKFTGEYHQNGDYGVPIFDNKYMVSFTKRLWGAIMAEALELENDGWAYCKWAWVASEEEIIPNPEDYK